VTSLIRQVIDSDALARQLGGKRRRRLRRPRVQHHPDRVARSYLADVMAGLNEAKAMVDSRLVPRLAELERLAGRRKDADRVDVSEYLGILATIIEGIGETAPPVNPETAASNAASEASTFNRAQVQKQLRGVIGVDVFFNEPALESMLADFSFENARLIKSVPAQYLDQVEALTSRGLRQGRRSVDVAKDIQARFGVAESRAKLIARDQISKINADLTRTRQESLGITEYIWRTSRDERVRPTHAALEGTTQRWDDPPAVGHPGEDFQCRCGSEPILPGAPAPLKTSPRDVPKPKPRKRRR